MSADEKSKLLGATKRSRQNSTEGSHDENWNSDNELCNVPKKTNIGTATSPAEHALEEQSDEVKAGEAHHVSTSDCCSSSVSRGSNEQNVPPSSTDEVGNGAADSDAGQLLEESGDDTNGEKHLSATPEKNHRPSSTDEMDTATQHSSDGEEDETIDKRYQLRSRFQNWSQSDTLCYRSGYPGKEDDRTLKDNYQFYANEIPSSPDGDFIDMIHSEWMVWHLGGYRLFPIRERGMNYHSQELQLHEAEKICSDPIMHARVLKSYELMLDFYGMKLKDKATGEIERSDNWKERFSHLNHSSHNYLRITRILKCLGEMEYEHLKAPFLRFVLHEAIVEGTLDRTLDSCMNYWLEVIKDDQERASIKKYAESFKNVSK